MPKRARIVLFATLLCPTFSCTKRINEINKCCTSLSNSSRLKSGQWPTVNSPALCNFLRFCSCAHAEESDVFRPLHDVCVCVCVEEGRKYSRIVIYLGAKQLIHSIECRDELLTATVNLIWTSMRMQSMTKRPKCVSCSICPTAPIHNHRHVHCYWSSLWGRVCRQFPIVSSTV